LRLVAGADAALTSTTRLRTFVLTFAIQAATIRSDGAHMELGHSDLRVDDLGATTDYYTGSPDLKAADRDHR